MTSSARRPLTVRLPPELVERVRQAAEISHRTVDDFVEAVLVREIARWDEAVRAPDDP